jgi:hypothetical protein
LRWLSPPNFKDNFEQTLALREAGTAEWLFDEPKFLLWKDAQCSTMAKPKAFHAPETVLWVQGEISFHHQGVYH